jgi:hypothetical protein
MRKFYGFVGFCLAIGLAGVCAYAAGVHYARGIDVSGPVTLSAFFGLLAACIVTTEDE